MKVKIFVIESGLFFKYSLKKIDTRNFKTH